MMTVQNHRGPDAKGIWTSVSRDIGLGHNRLAILDLSPAGDQPMTSEDRRYVIVFNGEIYNYCQLRNELVALGSQFRTQTDTEVVIEAYRHWGECALDRFRGMFSLAIYDLQEGLLFCARDRIGKKPFVYAQTHGGFAFASEIPALRQLPGVDGGPDHDAIAAMLLHNLRHIPDPHTAYRGIRRLRAGHAMTVRQGQIERIWRYWTPTPAPGPTTPRHLRKLLEEAVALRMQADVPVGALLSGGIDSSAIVALMQKQSAEPIHTYALGLDDRDEDLRRARIMAGRLGTVHRAFHFDPDEQWDIMKHLIGRHGEPIMLLPLVHTYALCRALREQGIKVVLAGNGADELFYGYTGHLRTLRVSRLLDRLAPLRPMFKPLVNTRLGWLAAVPGTRKAAYYHGIAPSEWAHSLTNRAHSCLNNRASEEMRYWGPLCPSEHFIDESNFVGLMVENPHSVTIAGDLPAMAASVEIRAPFLDQEIVAFALATPVKQKIPDGNDSDWLKAILREAVHDLIPDELLRAPKRGFGMGIQERDVLVGPWRDRVALLLENPNDIGGLLDPSKIRFQWLSFLAGKIPAVRIAKLLAIQIWAQEAAV